MLVGLATYLGGERHLPVDPSGTGCLPRRAAKQPSSEDLEVLLCDSEGSKMSCSRGSASVAGDSSGVRDGSGGGVGGSGLSSSPSWGCSCAIGGGKLCGSGASGGSTCGGGSGGSNAGSSGRASCVALLALCGLVVPFWIALEQLSNTTPLFFRDL
eukprot:5175668-Prymnesium_polylepis.1